MRRIPFFPRSFVWHFQRGIFCTVEAVDHREGMAWVCPLGKRDMFNTDLRNLSAAVPSFAGPVVL